MAQSNASSDKQTVLLGLFQAYLEDMGRIGARHETLRQFYVSVISALFVFLAMAGKDGPFQAVRGAVLVMVALVGVAICVSWLLHMRSFRRLFDAKRATLCRIEAELPFHPFSTEAAEQRERPRIHLTTVDQVVAVGFILLFGALLLCKVE
jgi:hypothetical protein